MKTTINISVWSVVAFTAAVLLCGELHEQAHFITMKILCGCWPASRDFNTWTEGTICAPDTFGYYASSIAGPLFSLSIAWAGIFLLRNPKTQWQSLGLVCIWSNVPQARIITVLMKGGDETVFFFHLLKDTTFSQYYSWFAIVAVLLVALPPVLAPFMKFHSSRERLYNAGFMVMPLIFVALYLFGFMNSLLASGFLAEPKVWGNPMLIIAHTGIVLGALLVLRKHLFSIVAVLPAMGDASEQREESARNENGMYYKHASLHASSH